MAAIVPGVPLGLDPLLQVNEFQVTRSGMFFCAYELCGPDGALLYLGTEERSCCGPQMDVRVFNTRGLNVLNLFVPFTCCGWQPKLQVTSGSGGLLGYIVGKRRCCSMDYHILNPSGHLVLQVEGPGYFRSMSDLHYKVLSADGAEQVAHITRVWQGLCRELCNGMNPYTIQFPADLSVNMKAMLLAATLFIDHIQVDSARRGYLLYYLRFPV